MSAHGFVAASRLQTTCFPNPHRTWGRRASWWMRSDDVPGPKHHIGQDPPNDDEDDNDRDDTCCTTTMTTLTDDRRLLRTATTATQSCLTVFSPVSRAIVFSCCPLSLSLSPSVRPQSSWSGSELRCNMAVNSRRKIRCGARLLPLWQDPHWLKRGLVDFSQFQRQGDGAGLWSSI